LRDYFGHLVDAMVDGRRRWGCSSPTRWSSSPSGTRAGRDVPAAPGQPADQLRGALTRARAEGALRPGVGPESAYLLVAVVQGMNVLAKTQPGRDVLQTIADAALAAWSCSPRQCWCVGRLIHLGCLLTVTPQSDGLIISP